MNKATIFSFIILLSAVGVLPTAAQQCFNKRYTSSSSASYFSNALENNGKFYVVSGGIDSINYIGGGLFLDRTGFKFIVMDSAGNVLHSQLYQRADKYYTYFCNSNNFQKVGDNFILAFSMLDTSTDKYNPKFNSYHLGIVLFDSTGNVILYKEYERSFCSVLDVPNILLVDFKPDAYGNWLMLSSSMCNGKIRFHLHKLDSLFDILWERSYATTIMSHTPKHLLIEPDGYVMSGSIDNENIMPYRANYYSSVLIKCDTAGDTLWSWHNKFDTTRLQYTINDIIRTQDGGYVYCGTGEGVPTYKSGSSEWSGIETKGWVEKLDASRKSVWHMSIGKIGGWPDRVGQNKLLELPNGDIMVAGSIPQMIDSDDVNKGVFIRGNFAHLKGTDGTILWQHFYGSPDANDTMRMSFYDMRPTSDGGYILAGEALNLINRDVGPIQRGWLVKVDSNGCIGKGDPQCWPSSISSVSLPMSNFIFYPNPSTGTLYISNTSLRGGTTTNIKVFDLLGRVVYEQSLILNKAQTPLALNLAKGTYILELRTEDAVQRERNVIE